MIKLKQIINKAALVVLIFSALLSSLVSAQQVKAAAAPTDAPIYATQFGSSGAVSLSEPFGIVADSSGNVYVADTYNNRIVKFDSSGTFLSEWGSFGSADGQFWTLTGITTDSSDNVYVTDTGNYRIQKFDSSGTFMTKWGSYGSADGQFNNPSGITTDSSDNVYVVDTSGRRIQKFDSSGTFMTKWGSFGSADGQFNNPSGITTDSSDNVYVTDTDNYRIQKFDSSGTFMTKWGSFGSADGQLSRSNGLTTDLIGNVYVADTDNSRIQKFDSNGTFLTEWGSFGSAVGQFNGPQGITADPSGYIYVVDTSNNRIQKFVYAPEAVTFDNSPNNGSILLETPSASTEITCHSAVSSSSLAAQDEGKTYPLGLVNFCLDVLDGTTHIINLTFETSLLPSQVLARKYNSSTQTFSSVPGASIIETTLDGKHALKLTYSITDGGLLDEDGIVNGTIIDPVGLAVISSVSSLASTGQRIQLFELLATSSSLLSLAYLVFISKRQKFIS